MMWFVLFCYTFFLYGVTIIFTQGIGPANIFFFIREIAAKIGDNVKLLVTCPLCFGTNLGWVFSLINWFFIPVNITPFNFVFEGTSLWWVAMIMDAAYAGALCKIIYNIDDYIDKITPIFEDEE